MVAAAEWAGVPVWVAGEVAEVEWAGEAAQPAWGAGEPEREWASRMEALAAWPAWGALERERASRAEALAAWPAWGARERASRVGALAAWPAWSAGEPAQPWAWRTGAAWPAWGAGEPEQPWTWRMAAAMASPAVSPVSRPSPQVSSPSWRHHAPEQGLPWVSESSWAWRPFSAPGPCGQPRLLSAPRRSCGSSPERRGGRGGPAPPCCRRPVPWPVRVRGCCSFRHTPRWEKRLL